MSADRLRELNDRLLICGNDCSDVLLDAAAEIERLRVERDEMTRIAGKAVGEVIDLQAKIDALRAENQRMRDYVETIVKPWFAVNKALAELEVERDALRQVFIDIKNFMMPDPCDDREPDAYKLMAGVRKIIAKALAGKEGE